MASKSPSIFDGMSFKTLIGLIFWGVGMAVLLMLWQWQIDRLVWKENLLTMMEKEDAREEHPLVTGESMKEHTAFHLVLRKYDAIPQEDAAINKEQLIFVGPRPKDGVDGYHIYAPLAVADSNISLMTHLGWVAKDDKDTARDALSDMAWPARVSGYFIPAEEKIVDVKNFPEQDIWLSANLQDFSAHFGLTLLKQGDLDIFTESRVTPRIFYYIETPLTEEVTPQLYKDISLPNDHAYYAQFWLTMAFLWSFIFLSAALWPVVKESFSRRK